MICHRCGCHPQMPHDCRMAGETALDRLDGWPARSMAFDDRFDDPREPV